MEDKKTLILIDGHALAFRMFFALERTNMQTTDHEPTWAVFGFFKAIFDLLADKKLNIHPNAIAVAFDVSKATFRLEKFEDYKANRLTMPDTLRSQLELIQEGLRALDIPIYTKMGYEGDDVIGTIAAKAKALGHTTYILTGDKDSFQLVDDDGFINVLIPSKGEIVLYNKQKVYEKMEVYPNQIIDYKALCGDTSDNIPGIRGIGPKTASSLLKEYDNLDNIYQNLDKITKKALNEKLTTGKESAYLSKFLATIVQNLEIDYDFNECCLTIPNKDSVKEFFTKVQIYSFVKNIDKLLLPFTMSDNACRDEIVKFEPIEESEKSNSMSQMNLFESLSQTNSSKILEITKLAGEDACAFVKENIKKGTTISFLKDFSDVSYCYLGLNSTVSKVETNKIQDILKDFEIKKITYDIKNILEDIEIDGVIADVELSSYIKDSSRKHDLITQINENLQIIPDENDYFELCYYLFELNDFYNKNLTNKEKELLDNIELPLSFVLKEMEDRGITLNIEYLKELGKEIDSKVLDYEKKIYDAAGTTFNINSPKQVAEILFEKLQIKPKKKGKSGTYSTNAEILENLAGEYKIASDILEHRQLMKLKTTYIDTLPKLVKRDGKIHTHFNQIVTTTGRLSSSDPNLQNIPIRTEFSNRIRAAFIPKDENYLIMSADYSQVELRLLAHFSEDEILLNAFKNDIDVHKITASKIFNVSLDDVTKDMRRKAKTVNFGIIYGQTRYGLAKTLAIDPYEAQGLIDKYFMTYPKISNYINSTLQFVQENGFVETLFARRRYLGAQLASRNANIRDFALRAAINAPLQGTSADIIKIAMVDLNKKLKDFKSKILLQIHDELVLEVHKDEMDEIKKITLETMEKNEAFCDKLKVPLKVEVGFGKTWMEK